MLTIFKRHPFSCSFLAFALVAQSAQSQGSESLPPPAPIKSENTSEPLAAAAADPASAPTMQISPAMTISDGRPALIQRLGITITPIAGWEFAEASQGMSLVMQEPKIPVVIPKVGEPPAISYRRSISVTSFDESYALNAGEAAKWMQRLQEIIGKGPGINSLVLNPDYKFFNYRQSNDGLVIYAQYVANDIPMTQVNVIVPAANRAFLITYSDMQSRFDAQPQLFSEAWASMVSLDVKGEPIWRYASDVTMAGAFAGIALLGFVLLALRRYRAQRFLAGFDMERDGDFTTDDSDGSGYSSISAISVMAPVSAISSKVKVTTKNQKSQQNSAKNNRKMPVIDSDATSKVAEQPISSVATSIHSGIWQLDLHGDAVVSKVSRF